MDARRAGTVHPGGTAEEIVAAEEATVRGELVDQHCLADPSRHVASVTPLSLMPNGWRLRFHQGTPKH